MLSFYDSLRTYLQLVNVYVEVLGRARRLCDGVLRLRVWLTYLAYLLFIQGRFCTKLEKGKYDPNHVTIDHLEDSNWFVSA